MNDKEIIALYWDRDESAIAETANRYGNYCYSIAYNILNTVEDAEECVNDTWMNTWKSIPPQNPNNLSTYLGKITRNLSFNRYKLIRAKKRGFGQIEIALSELDGCIPDQSNMEHVIDQLVLTNAIETFLRKQSQTERNIFVGRYWFLYHVKDLASAYHMSESKVTSLLFRMRKKLKLHLEKEGIFL